MIRLLLLSLVILAALLFVAVTWESLFNAILLTTLPLVLVVLVNAERINLFSSKKLGVLCAARGNALALVGTFLLPARITEILKPLYYKKSKGVSVMEGTAIVVLERVFDLLALIALSAGAFFFLPLSDSLYLDMARWFITISGFIVFVALWVVLLQPSLARSCIRFLPGRKIREWVGVAFDHLQSGMKQGLHPWQIFLTVIVWLGSWSAFWVFLQFDGGVALGLNSTLIVFLVGTLGLTVTVTPGGIGTFEAAVAAVLVSYGYNWDHALLSAVGLRVAVLLPNAVLAAHTVFLEGFDLLRVPQNVTKNS